MPLTAGRTLSSRVLAGFVVLIVVFTATMVWIVSYVDELRSEIAVIRLRYLRLTVTAKDLAGTQSDLYAYLKEELPGEPTPTVVARRLARMRNSRQALIDQFHTTLVSMHGTPHGHSDVAARQLERLAGIERRIAGLETAYALVLATPPLDRTIKADPPTADPVKLTEAIRARDQLLDAESHLVVALSEQSDSMRLRSERIAGNLEKNARRLRLFTGVMGVIAVAIGILITAWVILSLRPLRRLRTAASRIAAGDYGSRIDERGPTEVAALAREFNAMGRAVEERQREVVRAERLAAVGKMAAMITHEVRNPLSSIGLNAELLEEELAALSAGTEARELCVAIGREVDRLTAITEEYLTFARLPTPRLAAGSAAALVDDLARFVKDDLASRGVALTVEHAADVPLARLDEGQIRQSVMNLVRNAAEAVAGRPEGRVWIRTRATGDQVLIEVADDGPGIAPELRERLFDPFVSTKDGGTGLGLALTHQIVHEHGGTIAVISPPGLGATFTIALPRADAA